MAMRKWNQQVKGTEVASTAAAKTTKQTWAAVVDGITFISFVSYEDLMDKIREYRESK